MGERSQVGERIFTERNKRNWTQQDLADKVSVSRERIVKWESGERLIKAEDVLSLASAFNLDCHYLLTGDHRENITVTEELGLSDWAISTLKDWTRNSEQHPHYIAGLNIDESTSGEAESVNIVTPQETLEAINLILETHNGWRLLGLIYRYCFADFTHATFEGKQVDSIVFPNRSGNIDGITEVGTSLLRYATLKAIETELESLRKDLIKGEK